MVTEDTAPRQTLEGTVERIVYAGEEDAWSVVRLTVPGREAPVTAVGNLLGVQPGETVRLSGAWVEDRKYGTQFRAASYVTVRPDTLGGIERYLGSGMVKGIGPVMARRLVARFGQETLDVIESQPGRLSEVEGIGPVRARSIQEAWLQQRDIKEVMIFLQTYGVSAAWAARIYKEYGPRAVGLVRENPYRLAREVAGIGFLTADGIARRLGMAPDAPQRADAAVLHVLDGLADDGHVYAPRDHLAEQARALLEVDADAAGAAIERLAAAGEVVVEAEAGKAPARVYAASLFAAEAGAAGSLRSLLAEAAPPVPVDAARALAWFEERHGVQLAPGQREAVRRGLESPVLVITGGPGTGKTTLVNALIRILEAKGVRILLGAPTGRAAKRLAEATAREARTLHRLLEFNPRRGRFERHGSNPLEADLLIVDEASMVDLPLAHHLLLAVPPGCRLIWVGDVDQLPSVGPGAVLEDLIGSGAVEVVRLTEIFRQARASRIVVNAHRVNQGEMPLLPGADEESDFFFIERDTPEQILETLKEVVAQRIPARFRLHPLADVQVLTPMNRGLLGTVRLNAELQAVLNPSGSQITRGSRTLRAGDKVMQVRNNYDLDVFNGDIGRVARVDTEEAELDVHFDGRRVVYAQGDLDDLVPAYACSIHKSQGNEYPAVVIPLHTQHYVMLQRNLLYTALTRGRRLVVLVGSRRALELAVRRRDRRRRFTGLAGRLAQGPGPAGAEARHPGRPAP